MQHLLPAQHGQVSRNLVTGVAVLLITIAIVAYAMTEILGSITSKENSLGENVKREVETKAPTIFKLLLIVAIVIVIGVILRAIGVF